MKILQLSPKVEVRLPEDWALYRKEAHADKKRIDIKELGDIKEPLYTSISLLSDSSGTLLDYDNLIPGAEDLLKAFKEKLGFQNIFVVSGNWKCASRERDSLNDSKLVNDFRSVSDEKKYYAGNHGIPFLLEDTSEAQGAKKFLIQHEDKPTRQVWTIGVPYVEEYSPEVIDEITKAVLEVSKELKKL